MTRFLPNEFPKISSEQRVEIMNSFRSPVSVTGLTKISGLENLAIPNTIFTKCVTRYNAWINSTGFQGSCIDLVGVRVLEALHKDPLRGGIAFTISILAALRISAAIASVVTLTNAIGAGALYLALKDWSFLTPSR